MGYKFIFVDGQPTLINVVNSIEKSNPGIYIAPVAVNNKLNNNHCIININKDLEIINERLDNADIDIMEKTQLKDEKKILLSRKIEYLHKHNAHPFVKENGEFFNSND